MYAGTKQFEPVDAGRKHALIYYSHITCQPPGGTPPKYTVALEERKNKLWKAIGLSL